MDISEIKNNIVISDLLERLGHLPDRKVSNQLFYLSPIRQENTASFCVNDTTGEWYDLGAGVGGNIIDLGLHLFETTSVSLVVKNINILYNDLDSLEINNKKRAEAAKIIQGKHEVRKYQKLGQNQAITDYLLLRGIKDIAFKQKLIYEVYYDYIKDDITKRYFGAGWMNDSGGWEVRSKYGKTCITCRDISTINGPGSCVSIFESMIDYHSALLLNLVNCNEWIIILNGLGMKDNAINKLRQHNNIDLINLFLDHGKGGDKITLEFVDLFGNKVQDKRTLYTGFSDLNDKLNGIYK